jgi:hypothetical protein
MSSKVGNDSANSMVHLVARQSLLFKGKIGLSGE